MMRYNLGWVLLPVILPSTIGKALATLCLMTASDMGDFRRARPPLQPSKIHNFSLITMNQDTDKERVTAQVWSSG
jgi:hypothetical protein